jgi:hypothetical protein
MRSTGKALSDVRLIALGDGLASVPERLLLAHARREVLFVVGAGVSCQAHLPNFRELVLRVYKRLDRPTHQAMSSISSQNKCFDEVDVTALTPQQKAEVKRFFSNEHDVVLGMLERRMDLESGKGSSVRDVIAEELRSHGSEPAPIHRALIRLADRGQVAESRVPFARGIRPLVAAVAHRCEQDQLRRASRRARGSERTWT